MAVSPTSFAPSGSSAVSPGPPPAARLGELTAMLKLARGGIRQLTEIQQKALGRQGPLG
jgi:hypothetical protein